MFLPNELRAREKPGCMIAGRRTVVVVLVLMLGVLGGSSLAQTISPENCTWVLVFKAALPGHEAPRDFSLYAARRDAKWVCAVGSATTWNKAAHLGDMTGVTYNGGKLSGTAKITLQPDPWIPPDNKPVEFTITIDATLNLADPDTDGAVSGTYTAAFPKFDMAGYQPSTSGTVTGKIELPAVVDYRNCRISLICNDAWVGAEKRYQNRMELGLFFTNGVLSDQEYCQVGLNNLPYGTPEPIDSAQATSAEFSVKGSCVIPYKVLSMTANPDAEYRYSFSLVRVNNLLGGSFTAVIRRQGLPDSTWSGSIRGTAQPPAPSLRSIFDAQNRADRTKLWWTAVEGFTPVAPGEHPRLFFRKSDLPALRAHAETALGKAVLARLKATLGPFTLGGTYTPQQGTAEGAYTISHAAGFGFLYQLTGDSRYADLARQAFDLGLGGTLDRDTRYGWKTPNGELRAGPSIAWYALAYDLCYDAWDAAYRTKIAQAIQNWDRGDTSSNYTLWSMAVSPGQIPSGNHYGSIVGGAGIAVMSIMGDPGTDTARVGAMLKGVENNAVLAIGSGFGTHGFFSEGPGPSHVASNTALVPLFQALKVCLGRDYLTPRTNASWITLRWVMEIVPRDGRPYYPCRSASSYGNTNFLDPVGGMSHGGWFSQGFGAVPDRYKPALLWTYEHFVASADANRMTTMNYPHRAILAFINWPADSSRNPAQIMERAVADRTFSCFTFRNRWQDQNDILVSAWTGAGPQGFIKVGQRGTWVWARNGNFWLGGFGSTVVTSYAKGNDGSGVVSTADGTSLTVDFSKASGADGLLVIAGNGASNAAAPSKPIDGVTFSETTLGGKKAAVVIIGSSPAPEVKVQGSGLVIGGQSVAYDGQKITLGKTDGTWESPAGWKQEPPRSKDRHGARLGSSWFEIPTSMMVDVSLVDLNGRMVRRLYSGIAHAGRNRMEPYTGELSRGCYLVKMTAAGAIRVQRLASPGR